MIPANSNIAFKIAAKPLQMKTWLVLTAYRTVLVVPYLTTQSPTLYDVRFSHSTRVADRQQTKDTSYGQAMHILTFNYN